MLERGMTPEERADKAVRSGLEPVPPGEGDFCLDGTWFMPVWGCDQLDHIRDAAANEIRAAVAEAVAERDREWSRPFGVKGTVSPESADRWTKASMHAARRAALREAAEVARGHGPDCGRFICHDSEEEWVCFDEIARAILALADGEVA